MGPQTKKLKVARLSIISNTFLTLGKIVVGISINSISVISEGIHSGLDLMAAVIAYAAVRESNKPADDKHRYGHGKFENLAAIIEAVLILVAAILIVKESIPKLFQPSPITSLGLGAAIMGISALANIYVSSRLMKVAKETDSPALAADAWHLRTDVYTSLGVLVGIIAIKVTGFYIIDPIIAMGVALLIVKAAFDLIKESVSSILDVRLPDEEEKIIRQVLDSYRDQYVDYKRLRTRKAGPQRYIDFGLVVPRDKPIMSTHALSVSIKNDLTEHIPRAEVAIYPEPCVPGQDDCNICRMKLYYCLEPMDEQDISRCTSCTGHCGDKIKTDD